MMTSNAKRTYLDYNATTPIHPEIVAYMAETLTLGGNASSVHAEGRGARAVIEHARMQICNLVGADVAGLVFTSGGTEACNLALQTRTAPAGGITRLIVSAIEHSAILEPMGACGMSVTILPVDAQGVVDLDALDKALEDPSPALVCVMAANNETGVVQPIAEIGEKTRKHGSVFFCDGVQAAGKIALNMWRLNIDMLALSAHKIGGPAGVGALIAAPHVIVGSQLRGGGQELRRRAGTENLSGIAGFGMAADLTAKQMGKSADLTAKQMEKSRSNSKGAGAEILRDKLETALQKTTPEVNIFGQNAPRLPNTSCFGLAGVSAETLIMALDLDGIAVSAGSACSSGKVTRSHVLAAMGVGDDLTTSAIRVSFGRDSCDTDIDKFMAVWSRITYQYATHQHATHQHGKTSKAAE